MSGPGWTLLLGTDANLVETTSLLRHPRWKVTLTRNPTWDKRLVVTTGTNGVIQ